MCHPKMKGGRRERGEKGKREKGKKQWARGYTRKKMRWGGGWKGGISPVVLLLLGLA